MLTGGLVTLLIVGGGAVLFFVVLLNVVPIGLWISALAAGVRVSLISMVMMRLRRVPPRRIVLPMIKADKAGIDVEQNQLEAHYLAGGDVDRVVDAMIAADKALLNLTYDQAVAIDLAGRNVLEAVQVSVNPEVIQTPNISAVAKDGIELISTARVTVRASLERLVGGAGEETIIARVGEGIVSSIGSSTSHKVVLENPGLITQAVLAAGLDSGTAFTILSIDIADVTVGRNIGANLQMDQAEADKSVAQAKAEERRVLAVAEEQEMRARVEGMRARVVEAEAEIPKAMAEAFREGSIMTARGADTPTD
jgi:uncharacterized protein YqfA (UPF0365 family)